MYTSRTQTESKQSRMVKETTRFLDLDLPQHLSDPEELEPWTVEDVDDFLPSHDALDMDEFAAPYIN